MRSDFSLKNVSDHRLQIQNLFINGEKPTVIMLYTYTNRHAGTPEKSKTKTFLVYNKIGL